MFAGNGLASAGAALAAVALLSGCYASSADQEQGPPPAPEVSVADVLFQEMREWEEFTGRLEAVRSVEVRPRVGGYIESVHFEEGGRVEAGDVLFRIDPRPFRAEVERLTAEKERAQAQLGLATSNQERAARLLAENAIAQEEFDGLTTARAIAAAEFGAVEAALQAASLDLEFTTVTAPISGRVSSAIVTAGNLVDSATLLTTLVSDDPVYAYFDADERSYLDYVDGKDATEARAASVYIGLVNEEGYPHEGKLNFIDNQVNPATGTIRGRAVLENPHGRFTPGLFVRLKLVSPKSEMVALIDDRAVGTDLDRKFVLVLDDENVAQYRGVQAGPLLDRLRVIRNGLEPGDRVIVNGLQRVRPGTAVAPTKVAMERNTRALEQVTAASAQATH